MHEIRRLMAGERPNTTALTGICISGGGVRSAAFGLGALQSLQKHGKLQQAAYLSAVSGGGYIAGAWTLLNTIGGRDRPLEPGSKEVERIRARLDYLRGPTGWLVRCLQLGGRLVTNLMVIGLLVLILGIIAGLIYKALADPDAASSSLGFVDSSTLLWVSRLGWLALAYVIGLSMASVFDQVQASSVAPRLRFFVKWGLVAAVVFIFFGSVVPSIAERLAGPDELGRAVSDLFRAGATFLAASGVSGVLGVFASLSGRLGETPSTGRRVSALARRALTILLLVFASLAVPITATILFIRIVVVVYLSAGAGTGAWILALMIESTIIAVFAWKADPQTWSLHSIYRSSLATCYAMEPLPNGGLGDVGPDSEIFGAWPSATADKPELLICATANITDFGEAAAGTDAVPFLFTADGGGFSKDLPLPAEWFDRDHSGPSRMSIPSAVAVAASIVGPTMGKYTQRALANLITSLNLRLGVWLRNPLLLEKAPAPAERTFRKEKDFVVKGLRSRFLLKEYVGTSSAEDRYMYITDGGHYENLGIIELLRRGCAEIWCIDASGDKWGSAATIAAAMRLAEAELGVSWDSNDARSMNRFGKEEKEGRSGRYISDPSIRISGKYGNQYQGESFEVVFVKVGLSEHTAAHVAAFQEKDDQFPYHPTFNQFFSAEVFDAYTQLGFDSTERAMKRFGSGRSSSSRPDSALTRRDLERLAEAISGTLQPLRCATSARGRRELVAARRALLSDLGYEAERTDRRAFQATIKQLEVDLDRPLTHRELVSELRSRLALLLELVEFYGRMAGGERLRGHAMELRRLDYLVSLGVDSAEVEMQHSANRFLSVARRFGRSLRCLAAEGGEIRRIAPATAQQ